VASLVDTNILVYRFDPRDPRKQSIAEKLLREHAGTGQLYIPHQAIVEFLAVIPRLKWIDKPLMTTIDAIREAEELLLEFPILYPDEAMLRLAFQGMATYLLSWYDAHLWAYAQRFGMSEILSEDFQHSRLYGTVRALNPFLAGAGGL
jgi:predicted nucleic acid-binding protein